MPHQFINGQWMAPSNGQTERELPFGGAERSGHGRENGLLAPEEFCSVKTVVPYYGQ